jgi:O-antigen/teichoic acid export membrane protein
MSRPSPASWQERQTAEPPATVIGRGFSFRLGAQAISALINVAGVVLLGGYLAAEGYGQYAFYYALVPLVAGLSDLGVGVIITREVARDRAMGPRYLGDALIVKGAVSVVLMLGVVLLAPRLLDPAPALLMILVTAAGLIDISQDVGVWLFRANDRQDLEGLVLLVGQGLWVAGIAVCAALHLPVAWAIGVSTVAFAIRAIASAGILARVLYLPVFAFDRERIRSLIARACPSGSRCSPSCSTAAVGVLMLKGLASTAKSRTSTSATCCRSRSASFSSALSVSAFPSLARARQVGPHGVGSVLRRTLRYQLVMAMPIAVGLSLLAERVIPVPVPPRRLRAASGALKVLSLGLPLIFLNLTSRYVLAALDAQRSYLSAIMVGLAVNVGLSAALAGPFGSVGAALGLLGGELAVFIACQRALGRYMGLRAVLAESVRPALAALVMGAAVLALSRAPLFVIPVIGGAVYVGMLFALRVFSRDELRLLRGVYVSFGLPGSEHLMKARNLS